MLFIAKTETPWGTGKWGAVRSAPGSLGRRRLGRLCLPDGLSGPVVPHKLGDERACDAKGVGHFLRGRSHENTRTPCSPMVHDNRRQVPRISGRAARVESCTASWTHGFQAVSRSAPQQSRRACGERVAPLRGRTEFRPLHAMRPRSFLRVARVCGERVAPLRDRTGFSPSHAMHPRSFQRVSRLCVSITND